MPHFRGGRKAISEEAYPEMEEFYSDVATAYQEELRSLAERRASYVQLDDANLAYLCDPKMRGVPGEEEKIRTPYQDVMHS